MPKFYSCNNGDVFDTVTDDVTLEFAQHNTSGVQTDALAFASLESLPPSLSPTEIAQRLMLTYQQIDLAAMQQMPEEMGASACTTVYDGQGHFITVTIGGNALSFAACYDGFGDLIDVVRLNSPPKNPASIIGDKPSKLLDSSKLSNLDPPLDVTTDISSIEIIENKLAKPRQIQSIKIITLSSDFSEQFKSEAEAAQEEELSDLLAYGDEDLSHLSSLPSPIDRKIGKVLALKLPKKVGSTVDAASVAVKTVIVNKAFMLGSYAGHAGKEVSTYTARQIVELFPNNASLSKEEYSQLAAQIGLDRTKFYEDLEGVHSPSSRSTPSASSSPASSSIAGLTPSSSSSSSSGIDEQRFSEEQQRGLGLLENTLQNRPTDNSLALGRVLKAIDTGELTVCGQPPDAAYPIGEYMIHGGRVKFDLSDLSENEQKQFFQWVTHNEAKPRRFATHYFDGKDASGSPAESASGFFAWLKTVFQPAKHYGIHLAVGEGEDVREDGHWGEMYLHNDPRNHAMLIGIEGSGAMQRSATTREMHGLGGRKELSAFGVRKTDSQTLREEQGRDGHAPLGSENPYNLATVKVNKEQLDGMLAIDNDASMDYVGLVKKKPNNAKSVDAAEAIKDREEKMRDWASATERRNTSKVSKIIGFVSFCLGIVFFPALLGYALLRKDRVRDPEKARRSYQEKYPEQPRESQGFISTALSQEEGSNRQQETATAGNALLAGRLEDGSVSQMNPPPLSPAGESTSPVFELGPEDISYVELNTLHMKLGEVLALPANYRRYQETFVKFWSQLVNILDSNNGKDRVNIKDINKTIPNFIHTMTQIRDNPDFTSLKTQIEALNQVFQEQPENRPALPFS